MLKGKQGRFRQNLLGKRVDYSGRSVIVVGPQLKLHQCGLPKQMALELFKPFVMKRLVDLNHAQNIKSAKRMVERARPVVWDVLEEVITEHPVLLNRAPTLHRLGIQAFEPQLVEGKAIQIHPLVCTAFNADFDGDQMAVHLPLSAEAQAEARILMLSSNNILSPASGRPLAMPSLDMVTGVFHLSRLAVGARGEGRAFSSVAEAQMAFDAREIELQAKIKVRLRDTTPPLDWTPPPGWASGDPFTLETTFGRCLLNQALPEGYPFLNYLMNKKAQAAIVNDLAERYPKIQVAATLDALKSAGFYWATRSGVTVAIEDVVAPPNKAQILDEYEQRAERVQKQFDRGFLSDDERRAELVQIWNEATNKVAEAMEANFPETNPVAVLVNSGAAGNMMQIRQLAGMRGLVANPKGEIIPRPIKANFREGLSVVEYFISTHGARKGLADTALRTADSGYLTRRLVDVSQDVIVREDDCGTERGIATRIARKGADGVLVRDRYAETAAYARTLASDAANAAGDVVVPAGTDLGDVVISKIIDAGIESVKVRSALTCAARMGVCAQCYGRSLATGKLVDVGEAVGIVAAQSIGEPGTQLTMRTFHSGGVAGDDITQGLPRVVELFEARSPKGKAPISEVSGRVRIEETEKTVKVVVIPDDGSEEISYPVSRRSRLKVEEGQRIAVGQKIVDGAVDPHEVLRILGPRQVQLHLVDQVQEVYRSQGVSIHDKHIEIIIRQMLKRVNVLESGETTLLPGELVERARFEEENRRVVETGGQPASARPVLMGITKASLATESWLSAASFQETTRVLTDAAINARSDSLVGLKENVIIGKLIPAGTGISRYRNIRVEPTEEARASVYSVSGYDEGATVEYGAFGTGSGQAVPLDDFDYRSTGGDYR
ncbi:DNA-directed RNA polymerase subunit beta' [Protofrankia coriariae]|uniref:DNA-directed RNA polymerase subunit beta' n=1 Tax=Protofrankia coriariae TaxID=1562887 RepID=UPI000A4A4B26|nr:DNA-directed RNA polymerase subunit beta' [Protofrankia coriariae]